MDDDASVVVAASSVLSPVMCNVWSAAVSMSHLGSMMLQSSVSHLALYSSYTSLFSWSGSPIGQVILPSFWLQQPPVVGIKMKKATYHSGFLTVPHFPLIPLVLGHQDEAKLIAILLTASHGWDFVFVKICLTGGIRVTHAVACAGLAFLNLRVVVLSNKKFRTALSRNIWLLT